jgi:hypothetical protein
MIHVEQTGFPAFQHIVKVGDIIFHSRFMYSMFFSELECDVPALENGTAWHNDLTLGSTAILKCTEFFILSSKVDSITQTCIKDDTNPAVAFWSPVFTDHCEREFKTSR